MRKHEARRTHEFDGAEPSWLTLPWLADALRRGLIFTRGRAMSGY
jgi:hypothetical protein